MTLLLYLCVQKQNKIMWQWHPCEMLHFSLKMKNRNVIELFLWIKKKLINQWICTVISWIDDRLRSSISRYSRRRTSKTNSIAIVLYFRFLKNETSSKRQLGDLFASLWQRRQVCALIFLLINHSKISKHFLLILHWIIFCIWTISIHTHAKNSHVACIKIKLNLDLTSLLN